MIAAIDIGNTRTKIAVFRDDGTVAAEKAFATGENFTSVAKLFDGGWICASWPEAASPA